MCIPTHLETAFGLLKCYWARGRNGRKINSALKQILLGPFRSGLTWKGSFPALTLAKLLHGLGVAYETLVSLPKRVFFLPTGICNKQPISWPEGSQEAVMISLLSLVCFCPALSAVSFDFAQQSTVHRELVGDAPVTPESPWPALLGNLRLPGHLRDAIGNSVPSKHRKHPPPASSTHKTLPSKRSSCLSLPTASKFGAGEHREQPLEPGSIRKPAAATSWNHLLHLHRKQQPWVSSHGASRAAGHPRNSQGEWK